MGFRNLSITLLFIFPKLHLFSVLEFEKFPLKGRRMGNFRTGIVEQFGVLWAASLIMEILVYIWGGVLMHIAETGGWPRVCSDLDESFVITV